jgi:hypothetical protein
MEILREFSADAQAESKFVPLPEGAQAALLTLVGLQIDRNERVMSEAERNGADRYSEHSEWGSCCQFSFALAELCHALSRGMS